MRKLLVAFILGMAMTMTMAGCGNTEKENTQAVETMTTQTVAVTQNEPEHLNSAEDMTTQTITVTKEVADLISR